MKFFTSIRSNSKYWLVLPLFAFIAVLWKNSDKLYLYQQTYSPKLEYARYQNSAYFQGDNANYILSDEQVNVIRGVEQLIIGKNPQNTLPGHPFLASYVYAFSIILFGSPYFASLTAVILSVLFLYLVGRELGAGLRSISVLCAFFILDPLFNESLFNTMLDIYLCLFSIIAIYFFVRFQKTQRQSYISLASLFVGFMLSTKFYPASLPLMAAFFFVVLLKQDYQVFKKSLFALPFALLGFLIGHFTYFIHNHNLIDFVRYQRYLQNWWAGSPSVSPFIVFKVIFQNQWPTWWGAKDVLVLPYWSPVWGILLLCSARLIKIYKSPQAQLFIFWITLSLTMFSFMAFYPRHLLAVLPGLYLTILVKPKTTL